MEEGRPEREGLGRHRVRLVHGAVRDDAALALEGRPEPVRHPQPRIDARGLRRASRSSSSSTRSARTAACPSSRRRRAPTSTWLAPLFQWYPDPQAAEGREYTLHLSALDVNHGFSLYPINVNFQVVPGYDYGLRVTPNASGDFRIICNEFCGIGHHIMVGRVIVETAGATSRMRAAPDVERARFRTCPATGLRRRTDVAPSA